MHQLLNAIFCGRTLLEKLICVKVDLRVLCAHRSLTEYGYQLQVHLSYVPVQGFARDPVTRAVKIVEWRKIGKPL